MGRQMGNRIAILKDKDWEKARGVICSNCGEETLRVIASLCPQCHNDKLDTEHSRRVYQRALRRGTVSLAQMRNLEFPQDS